MKQITEYSEIVEIEQKYKVKGTATNNYILKEQYERLISDNALCVVANEKNCFLFVTKDIGTRIYYFINDMGEKADFSKYSELVIEILFRGELPVAEMEYFLKCGFETNLVRDQYCLRFRELNPEMLGTDFSDIDIHFAETIEEAKMCVGLFNENFDRYSGNYIDPCKLLSLIENKNLYIAYNEGILLGSLHVSKGGNNLYWMDHLVVTKEARGKHVATKLFIRYIFDVHENESTRYQLWTQHQNEIAVKMYKKIGFKYLGKSTLSMIKIK